MTATKRQAAAALLRRQIASGQLGPGAPTPSGARLAREAGCSVLTARLAVRALVADGTLMPGASPGARPHVALSGGGPVPVAEALARDLSGTLAALRRGTGLTQPELAAKLQTSVTSLGHAETGRLWQSRAFWVRADELLGGGLLRLFDRYSAARAGADGQDGSEPRTAAPVTVWPASVGVTAGGVAVVWPDGSSVLVPPPGTEPEGSPHQ